MATTREQFIALRKSGMTPVQAREEVMKTVTPTTPGLSVKDAQGFVAGTPTYNQGQNNGWGIEDSMNPRYANRASTNVNQQQLINNQNKVQAEIQAGTRPAVGTSATPQAGQTQATTPTTPTTLPPAPVTSSTTPSGATMNADGTVTPVNPQTGLTQPAPVEIPQAPIGATNQEIVQAGGRVTNGVQEMPGNQIDKTSEIKAQTDSQMAINKQNADLKEQERQRIAEETRIANTPKSASEMYSLITAKAPISDEVKSTSAYRIANNRYQRASKYLTMTPTQVASEIKSAKLIEGSEAWNDLSSMNPKLVQDATNLRNVNGNKTNIWTYKNNPDGTQVKENNLEKQFSSDYLDDYGDFLREIYKVDSPETINSKIRTQAVVDAETRATEYETELNAIEKDINAIEKDVEKELTGSGATGSRARLEKIARKEALQSEYNSILKSYTMYANKANDLIKNNTENYKSSKEQENKLTSALATAAGAKYQNELALAQNQAEYDQKIAQQAQAMNDPTMAISSMIDEYKKLGIPFNRSTQQVISDFQTSGKDLPTYLTELQKTIQSKPEYQKIQALQQGQMSDAQKMNAQQTFDLQKIGINNQQDIQKIALQYNLKNSSDIQSAKIDLMSKGATSYQADSIIRNATGDWKGASGQSLLSAVDGTVIPTRLSQTTNPNGGKECAEYVNDITGAGLGSTWDSKKSKIDTSITTPTAGDTAIWIPDPSNKNFAKYGHAGIVTASDGTNVTIKSSNLNGQGEISTVTVPISQITQTGGFSNTSIKGSTTTKPLSDQQYTQYNQATSKFVADPNVKAFESALAGGGDLMASLKSANGPGDVGAVFNFMKTLDPSSTVREGEFALAAKSAGVWEQFKNIPANKLEGTILTDEQRKALGKLAFEYVKNKGKSYDIKYDDYTRILKNQGIPESYYPTKMTSVISKYDGTDNTNTTSNPLSVEDATAAALAHLNGK